MDRDLLLCEVLGCGTSDLVIIENCGYDISDIIELVNEFGNGITLGAIAYGIKQTFCENITSVVEEKIDELKEELKEAKELEDHFAIEILEEKIDKLEALHPHDDFELWFNYLDTHISCISNANTYEELLEDEVRTEEGECGLTVNLS